MKIGTGSLHRYYYNELLIGMQKPGRFRGEEIKKSCCKDPLVCVTEEICTNHTSGRGEQKMWWDGQPSLHHPEHQTEFMVIIQCVHKANELGLIFFLIAWVEYKRLETHTKSKVVWERYQTLKKLAEVKNDIDVDTKQERFQRKWRSRQSS